MILPAVRLLRKLTYSIESRRLAKNANPAAKARIWPQIGVLQLPLLPLGAMEWRAWPLSCCARVLLNYLYPGGNLALHLTSTRRMDT